MSRSSHLLESVLRIPLRRLHPGRLEIRDLDSVDPGRKMRNLADTANAKLFQPPGFQILRNSSTGAAKSSGTVKFACEWLLCGPRNHFHYLPLAVFLRGEAVVPRVPAPQPIAIVAANAAVGTMVEQDLIADIALRIGPHQDSGIRRPVGTGIDLSSKSPNVSSLTRYGADSRARRILAARNHAVLNRPDSKARLIQRARRALPAFQGNAVEEGPEPSAARKAGLMAASVKPPARSTSRRLKETSLRIRSYYIPLLRLLRNVGYD